MYAKGVITLSARPLAIVATAEGRFAGQTLAASGAGSKSARTSRRPNAAYGRLVPAFAELVKAHKRGRPGGAGARRGLHGLVRLGEAIASGAPGVSEAALAAAPLAHGGVPPTGAAAMDQIRRVRLARAPRPRPRRWGRCSMDGADGAGRLEVPPDVVARACAALRASVAIGRGPPTRLAALDSVVAAAPSCGSGADLAPLARDGTALRRAAMMVFGLRGRA